MSTMCRSCVAPKLVSKGCNSRMRSSRISICLMNTPCSGNKKIVAAVRFALEPRDEIVILQVLEELPTHAKLHILRRLHTLFLQSLNVGWNEYAPNVTFNRDAGSIDPPFRDHAVALQSALQLGCGCAVQIDVVPADDNAKLSDIEISVF